MKCEILRKIDLILLYNNISVVVINQINIKKKQKKFHSLWNYFDNSSSFYQYIMQETNLAEK